MEYTVRGDMRGVPVECAVEADTAVHALDLAEERYPALTVTAVFARADRVRARRRRIWDRWARHPSE